MKSPKLSFIADYDDKLMSEEVLEQFILEERERENHTFELPSLQSFPGECQKGVIGSKPGFVCC